MMMLIGNVKDLAEFARALNADNKVALPLKRDPFQVQAWEINETEPGKPGKQIVIKNDVPELEGLKEPEYINIFCHGCGIMLAINDKVKVVKLVEHSKPNDPDVVHYHEDCYKTEEFLSEIYKSVNVIGVTTGTELKAKIDGINDSGKLTESQATAKPQNKTSKPNKRANVKQKEEHILGIFRNIGKPLTLPELLSMQNIYSEPGLYSTIMKFVQEGVVKREKIGKSPLYFLVEKEVSNAE